MAVPVYLELGPKRTFACAWMWLGWCRSGKTEEQALDTLAAYADRYRPVAERAGFSFPKRVTFDVIERVPGSATTDFGAPGAVPAADQRKPSKKDIAQCVQLVAAAWETFEEIAAAAPAELRKGPRGGGRDRDKIVAHVADAELSYVTKIGLRIKTTDHPAMLDALEAAFAGSADGRWPPRYLARRIAWHALDHAWEIEDRST